MSNLPVGKITKLYGTEGEVVANLYDRFPADYDSEEPLFVSIDSLTVPLFISSFTRRGRGAIIAIDGNANPMVRLHPFTVSNLLPSSMTSPTCERREKTSRICSVPNDSEKQTCGRSRKENGL